MKPLDKTYNVGVLLVDQAIMSSVVGPMDIFNKVFKDPTNPLSGSCFNVEIIGSDYISKNKTAAKYKADDYIHSEKKYDLIIVPAMQPQVIQEVLVREKKTIAWLREQHAKGSELASICVGSFFLASTGLLDGKRATTHWVAADMFRQAFPQVVLEDEKIIIDEGKIYTCGGAFAFTSMIIYLIEKYCSKEHAVTASKIFLVNFHGGMQNEYAIFNTQKSHNDKLIKDLQAVIEREYQKNYSLDRLADISHLGKRTLIRRFKTATGSTPLEYIQRVRVEAAKKMLEGTNEPAEQICRSVGYEDYPSFATLFKRYTGATPAGYRRQYTFFPDLNSASA